MSLRVLPMMELPYLIRQQPNGATASVYGVLREQVVPPANFAKVKPESPTDCYAVVDLVGITYEGEDFFVHGQLLTVVSKSFLEQAKSKPSGRLAVKLTGRPLKLANEKSGLSNFVTMFGWRKSVAGGSWSVLSPTIMQMSRTSVPEFLAVVTKAYQNGWEFTFPTPIPDDYVAACEGYGFKPVLPESLQGDQELASGPPSSGENVPEMLSSWGSPTVDPNSGVGSIKPAIQRGTGGFAALEGDFGVSDTPLPDVPPDGSLGGAGASLAAPPGSAAARLDQASKAAPLAIGPKFQGRKELAPVSDNYPIMVQAFGDAEDRVKALIDNLVEGSQAAFTKLVMVDHPVGEDAAGEEAASGVAIEGAEGEAELDVSGSGVDLDDEGADDEDVEVPTAEELEGEFEEVYSPIFQPLVEFMAERVRASWTRKEGHVTGRALLKLALEKALEPGYPQYVEEGEGGTSMVTDYLEYYGADMLKYLTGEYRASDIFMQGIIDRAVDADLPAPDLAKFMNLDDDVRKFLDVVSDSARMVYFRMVMSLLGLTDKTSNAINACEANSVDPFWLMALNPYKLCLLDQNIGVTDMDKLAMMYGVDRNAPEIVKSRNVAYMHNFMLDSSNWIIKDNTIVKYYDLQRNVTSGYALTKMQYDQVMAEGRLVLDSRLDSLAYYIRQELNKEDFVLPQQGWAAKGRRYVLRTQQNPQGMVQDYVDSGVGIRLRLNGDDLVASYVFFKKELYIYTKLRQMAEKTITVDPEELRACIAAFEQRKDRELGLPPGTYKLEERQADAIMMSEHPIMCMTGPAGSGKTTTVEARVAALEEVVGASPNMLMFCAPTGKAAGRLKEVVKRPTSTINSLFRIGGNEVSLREEEEIREMEFLETLVMDESSMPNLLLFYDMLRRVNENTRITFLGDIEQLPPIGFGKPFANLMSFLPTVVLNINKRSSEKSTIAKNNKRIIYESDGGRMEDLIDGPDYRIIDERDPQKVVQHVFNICKYHLGKGEANGFTPVENNHIMHPDDIQVISPVNEGVWGINDLNARLQNIFNPNTGGGVVIKHNRSMDHRLEYRIGDRVIHTRKNWKRHFRFHHNGGSSFTYHDAEWNKGINNGDVGKVLGFFHAEDIEIEFMDTCKEKTQREVDKTFHGGYSEKRMFLGVVYKDVDLTSGEIFEFVCFYRMDILLNLEHEITVTSKELECLDLAYALTVHRLQGSQAKLIVMVILPVGKGGSFISRNMIYTASSRAQESGYLAGDVYGPNSAVNKGRRVKQTEIRSTLLDYL